MPGALQSGAVLVMDLPAEDAVPPRTALRRRRSLGARCEREARSRIHRLQPASGEPLEDDTEQDKVDVRINRRPSPPFPLQHEGPQQLGIASIGVNGLDRGEGSLVPEAL